eukprot:6622026-Pyramimonas_sp.AAC.1
MATNMSTKLEAWSPCVITTQHQTTPKDRPARNGNDMASRCRRRSSSFLGNYPHQVQQSVFIPS